MNKKLKLFFSVLLVLVVICVSVIVMIKIMYPKEKLKALAINKIAYMMDRKVEIGDVLIKYPGICMKNIVVYEKDNTKQFITVKNLDVRFKFFPLIFKKFIVKKIYLDDASFHVIKLKNKLLNCDDLINQNSNNKKIGILAFVFISDIKIKNSKFIFDDFSDEKMSYSAENINIDIDGISLTRNFGIKCNLKFIQKENPFFKNKLEFNLSFDFDVNVFKRKIDVNHLVVLFNKTRFDLTGKLNYESEVPYIDINLKSHSLSADDLTSLFKNRNLFNATGNIILDLSAKGAVDDFVVKTNIDFLNANIKYFIFNKKAGTRFNLSGETHVQDKNKINVQNALLNIDGIVSSAKINLDFSKLISNIDLNIKSENLNLSLLKNIIPNALYYDLTGKTDVNFSYKKNINNSSLSSLISIRDMHAKTDSGVFDNLRANIFLTNNILDIKNMQGLLDGKKFDFNFNVNDFKRPKGIFSLKSDFINLNKFITQKPKTETGYNKAPFVLPLPVANGDINGNIDIKKLIYKKLEFENINANTIWRDKILRMDPLKFDMCDGKVSDGKFSITLIRLDEADYLLSFGMTDLNVEKFFSMIGVFQDRIDGSFDCDVKLRGRGMDLSKIYSKGNVKFSSGKFKNIKVFTELNNVLKLASSNPNEFPYKNISMDYEIKNGYVQTDNFVMNSDSMDIFGKGSAGILDNKIDFVTNIKFAKGLLKGFLADVAADEDGRVTQIFNITGTFNDPKYVYVVSDQMKNKVLEKLTGK
jgi:uncharacterized protein involved in outer membrane biogenesis